jgi:hypothetical protein
MHPHLRDPSRAQQQVTDEGDGQDQRRSLAIEIDDLERLDPCCIQSRPQGEPAVVQPSGNCSIAKTATPEISSSTSHVGVVWRGSASVASSSGGVPGSIVAVRWFSAGCQSGALPASARWRA